MIALPPVPVISWTTARSLPSSAGPTNGLIAPSLSASPNRLGASFPNRRLQRDAYDQPTGRDQDERAVLLGVGRTFITRVVNRLRSTGIIGTKRGSFVIEDELALKVAACPCAAAIDQHFHTVLRGIYSA